MLKILFLLRKSDNNKGKLEYVSIDNPKKVLEGKLLGMYACEVYLPKTEKKHHLIYADNPIEALCFASEFTKGYLQSLINSGYIISEVENKELWKLEGKDSMVNLQEKLEAIKNNKDFSQEDKEKILGVLKGSFGKESSPIKDEINKLI